MVITKLKIFGLVMGIGLFLFMATPVLAYDTFPLLICGYENAPAGEFCTVCDTFAQIQHLLNFLFFYLVPVAATVLFIYGGFLVLLGGATPSTVQQGYGVFRKTAYGLFIIYGAWLIINFTLNSLSPADSPARNWWNFEIECRDDPGARPVIRGPLAIISEQLPAGVTRANYSVTLEAAGGTSPYQWSLNRGQLPEGLRLNESGIIAGVPTQAGEAEFELIVRDQAGASAADIFSIKTTPAGTTAGELCRGTGKGEVCSGTLAGRQLTDTLSCSPVNPGDGCDATVINRDLGAAIQKGASNLSICSGVNTVTLLKAIVANESNGEIDIGSSDGLSSGPFQLTPNTGRLYAGACGVSTTNLKTDSDWFKWLRSSNTVEKQACMAAKFLKSLAEGVCGCDVRQLAAGYNGGGAGKGACNTSTNCGPSAAADGGECSVCAGQDRPTKRWECLWDDNTHTQCNIGRVGNFAYTRQYAPKVEFCYNLFK